MSTQAARNQEADPRLLHSDDLPDNFGEAVLPVVHCRECAGMAWVTATNPDNSGFVEDKDAIYREYFAKPLSHRLVYLLTQPPDRDPRLGVKGGARTCLLPLPSVADLGGRTSRKVSRRVPGMQRKRLASSVEDDSRQERR